jgi:hypothetical protein
MYFLRNNRVGIKGNEILVVAVLPNQSTPAVDKNYYDVAVREIVLGGQNLLSHWRVISGSYTTISAARDDMEKYFRHRLASIGFEDFESHDYHSAVVFSQIKPFLAPEPDEPDPDLVDIRYPIINEVKSVYPTNKVVRLKCLNNLGIENRLVIGKEYQLERTEDGEMLKVTDEYGEPIVVFAERFFDQEKV